MILRKRVYKVDRKIKRILVVMLAICMVFTQGNMHVFARENEENVIEKVTNSNDVEGEKLQTVDAGLEIIAESKYEVVEQQVYSLADASVKVFQTDSYETVLINAVAAFKQAILTSAENGETETSVTFSFETSDSYEKMFDYLTSYFWYLSDWEPEMGLLEMALYNEPELRSYMNYGSTESHFVMASENEEELTFTIYWPIYYNQPVVNHVSVSRSDGNVEKQSFPVLEDVFDTMEMWNELYGADVDYTIEFLDLTSSLIAPDRQELPEANHIEFIATDVWEDVGGGFSSGVGYTLYTASDLHANSNISMTTMDIKCGTSGKDVFVFDMGGATFSSYGFNDAYFSLVNADVFVAIEANPDPNVSQNQTRLLRIFGSVDLNGVYVQNGRLELARCYNSKIKELDNVGLLVVSGTAGDRLEIGTLKDTELNVSTGIDLVIRDMIATGVPYAELKVGMPEKGSYPTITGTVTDGNGNNLPLVLMFGAGFYSSAYDDSYYHNINIDRDWNLLKAPNVDNVSFELAHSVYDENGYGRRVEIQGILSKRDTGEFFLKSSASWDGMEQSQKLELNKPYQASIRVYQDGELLDDSKITTSFHISSSVKDSFTIEQNGNNFTYSCNKFGFYAEPYLQIEIDQEEGITSWRFPIFVYGQKEVESISIPGEKLTYVEGLGNVYLMVMNGLIYNVNHEGIIPNVVSDEEYFIRYTSNDESILEPDYKTGELFAYGDGICEITAWSGNKSVTYKALVGKRTSTMYLCINNERVYSWTMNVGEQIKAEIGLPENSLEGKYGYKVTWESTDESVMKVDVAGNVKAIKSGNAKLKATATCLDGTKLTKEFEICVLNPTVEPENPTTVEVTSVTLNKTAAELKVGELLTLTATVNPSNATDKTVTWTTSAANVATVDENGKVTAVAAGTATITAKAGDKTATCVVTVNAKVTEPEKPAVVPVTSITLDKTTAALKKGETVTLTETVNPSNATDKTVTWTTSNANVATVANGKVTAVADGTAVITAKAGDKTATCVVTVNAKVTEPEKPADVVVSKVTLNKKTANLGVGKTLTLKATVTPKNATNQKLTWSSSNKKVATVDKNGKVKGVKAGTATITVKTANGKKATCKVTVVKATLNATSLALQVKKSVTLKATSSLKTDKVSSWKSSNTKVATVKSGKVTAKKAGTAKITVTMKSGATATCTIKVQTKAVASKKLTLNKTKATLKVGKSLTLKVTRNPITATDKLTWTSSNKKIATVDKNGKVKAIKAGTATITVKTASGAKAKLTVKVIKK